MQKLHRGVNLEGWLSLNEPTDEHLSTFITEADFAQIKGFGFDHVRMPVDYPLIQSDEPPYPLLERGLEWVDRGVAWAKANDLRLIIDLHHAPGFHFNQLDQNTLFESETMQQRLIAIWQHWAERYQNEPGGLYFELINEIVTDDPEEWNALAARLIDAIRKIDPKHMIVVGSTQYNSPQMLEHLRYFGDESDGILYTFHTYAPFTFTHQKAGWTPLTQFYNETVEYPSEGLPNLDALREKVRAGGPEVDETLARFMLTRERALTKLDQWASASINRSAIEAAVEKAAAFRDKNGVSIFCGEFGAYAAAPEESRIRYFRDAVDVFEKYAIPYTAWSYKGRGFGIVDADSTLIHPEIKDILIGKA
jgi:aryl-phospho-beta-D-glucosidase BglC (GH1 family)